MKQLSVLARACLPVLLLGLASIQAQEPLGRAKPAAGLVPPSPVYTGHSLDGNFQEALDDALSQAQQGLAESTMIADQTFGWDLSGVRGVRGGIMGQQDIWVELTVR